MISLAIPTRSDAMHFLRRNAPALMLMFFVCVLMLMPHTALASTADSSSGNLPWESPLKSLRDSFSGPVAFAISLIGIVVCGAMLIWGGEINEFARRMIMVVLVVAVIVLANSVLTSLFSSAEVLSAPHHAVGAVKHALLGCRDWQLSKACTGHGI